MRHNKLAGTRFLLGSRKHKPSTFTSSSISKNTSDNTSNSDITADCNCGNTNTGTTNNNNMLHSKSTYFYRWFSEHLDLVVSGLSTKNTNKVSKVSKTNKASKASHLVPAVCGAALLGAFCVIVNPAAGKTEAVYAATDDDECKTSEDPNTGICAMELGIFMNGTDSAFNELPATELSTDSVVHRDYSFSIRAVDTKDGYDLYAGVVNTGSFGNGLVNADYPTEEYMIKALSGENIAYSSIGNNEWGYALATEDTYTTPAEELTYNSLPTTTITTENNQTILTSGKLIAHGEDTGYDPSQPVGQDKHTDQDYKLYFAAKASPESPSGHYRTQVMLSLVANAKMVISGLGGITKMSEMTSAHCKSLPDVTPGMTKVPTGQLIDDREGENGTKYWVSKLADGDCWMTQNMAYGNSDASKKSVLYVQENATSSYYEGTTIPDGYKLSNDSAMVAELDSLTKTYNGHYLLGNYYNSSQAVNVCNYASWKLPAASAASKNGAHGSFGRLLGAYDIGNNSAGSVALRGAPLYFLYGGFYLNTIRFNGIGSTGYYRSPNSYYDLYLTSSSADPNYGFGGNASDVGISVRCVVSGE